MSDRMRDKLAVNDERYKIIFQVKEDFLKGRIGLEEGRKILKEKIGTCTPEEFAYGEQKLKDIHDDEEIYEKMDDILVLFEGIMVRPEFSFPPNHPLGCYLEEIAAMNAVLVDVKAQLEKKKFILNEWLGLFDKLRQWTIHLSRKQNQLYPVLESYGFDRPTKIMWTFDDKVRDLIRASYGLLEAVKAAIDANEGPYDVEAKVDAFLASINPMIDGIEDLCGKESEVLIPTSRKLLSNSDFTKMSVGDHEIGFALIETPGTFEAEDDEDDAPAGGAMPPHGMPGGMPHGMPGGMPAGMPGMMGAMGGGQGGMNPMMAMMAAMASGAQGGNQNGAFLPELMQLLGKYGMGPLAEQKEEDKKEAFDPASTILDVATGKLTLNQINLLFKHMPVDLSYVDETELVKFYSDTKHRIFPRSANVIGREVRNCHPRTSVHVVEEIIEKFRSGEQDQVDFWINKPDVFIYVLYTAIRDEEGNFRGIMEMMQDCTHIRSLEGSRTLLTWEH